VKLILYFADGFSWQYLQQRPFMERFWERELPLQTLVGYSSTIMPSILTGRLPRETGMWTEYYLDPRPRGTLQRLLSRPRLRPALPLANLGRLAWFRVARRAGLGREHRLRIPLELSHLFERHPIHYDRFPPIGLGVPTLADRFAELGLRVDFRYLGQGPDPEPELKRLSRRVEDHDVFFFYDPSLDAKGHRAGASAQALGPEIDRIEHFLRGAWDLLAAHGSTEAMLFSDHGMTTLTGTFDLFGHLRAFELGRDYLVFMDSTLARFWFPDAARRGQVLAALEGVPGRLLDRAQEREHGIDFEDDRYAQDVLVADEGIVFHPNYFAGPFIRWARRYPELAMHGYMPDAPSSRGIFMHRGSGLRSALPDPFRPTDIFAAVDEVLAPADAQP